MATPIADEFAQIASRLAEIKREKAAAQKPAEEVAPINWGEDGVKDYSGFEYPAYSIEFTDAHFCWPPQTFRIPRSTRC